MPPSTTLIEIYEERIARLEEGVGDIRVDVGVLKAQLAAGIDMLSDKLDAVAKLSDRVAMLETREQITAEVKEREELSRVKRHEKRVRIFKIGAALGSGIVAILGLLAKILFGG